MKSRSQPPGQGPGWPLPIAWPSMVTTGIAIFVADVMKASRARKASSRVKARSSTLRPSALATSITVARVTPGRISLSKRTRHKHAFGCHNPGIARGALCDSAGSIDKPSLARTGLAGRVFCQDGRQQHNGFDIAPAPAIVRHRFDARCPFRPIRSARPRGRARAKTTSVGKTSGPGKANSRGPAPRVTCI